jgi:hypothetical protein
MNETTLLRVENLVKEHGVSIDVDERCLMAFHFTRNHHHAH